jgi:hypothetical protein
MADEKPLATDFELMDREDEDQILSELRGVPVDKFIYKNSRGQPELSYAGTKWAVREMAITGEAIRVELPKVERCPIDPEYIIVNIIGKRVKVDKDANCETLLDTNVGSARGWIKQKMKDGRVIPDEFFYNKTVSKATRNVQQMLMPADFKQKIIDALVKNKSGGGPRPPGGRPPQGGPPPRNGPPAHGAPPARPPAQGAPPQRPPLPGGRPSSGGFAGEAPFPASPSQGQTPPPPRPPQQQRPPAPPQQRPPAPPPPQQQRQAPPPVPGVPHQTQSPPGQPPRQAAIDVLHQRFEIVLKQAIGTNDRNVALQALHKLTGYQRITDLSKEFMEEMGPVLNRVVKQELRYGEGVIWDPITSEYLFPKPEPQYEETPPPQEEPPPPPAEEPMF